jgi:hypothetical protein
MKATLLALSLACLGAAVTLEDRQWVQNHAWLVPAFWIGAVAFGMIWTALLLRIQKSRLPATIQATTGNLSPNIIASQGSTIHFNTAPQSDSKLEQKRPYVRPVEYTRVSQAEIINSGYKEFLRVSNHGERAYGLRVETLRVGEWNVEFAPLSYLTDMGDIFVSIMSKTTHINGQPHRDIKHRLEDVWHDAYKTPGQCDKLQLAIHYHDYQENPYLSVCSIEMDRHPNGVIFFRLADFEDLLVVPTRGHGLYAT